jgi:hypothetical protein
MTQFLIRVVEVCSYVSIFFALGSLLDREGIAWVVRVRSVVKQRHSRQSTPTA